MTPKLRPVTLDDLPTLFEQQRDPAAHHMAAFTHRDPDDRAGYIGWWQRILADDTVQTRAIDVDGALAGSILCWPSDGGLEISYWLGRAFWGRGIATEALRRFVGEIAARPMLARAASDNRGSLRVLARCGFVEIGREIGFAGARGADIEETVMRLDRPPSA